jgi:hypothetical protein
MKVLRMASGVALWLMLALFWVSIFSLAISLFVPLFVEHEPLMRASSSEQWWMISSGIGTVTGLIAVVVTGLIIPQY